MENTIIRILCTEDHNFLSAITQEFYHISQVRAPQNVPRHSY